MTNRSREVRLFVSYARANGALARRFMDRLHQQLAASRRYEYRIWQDGEILVGEDWHSEIVRALDSCTFGLLLVSAALLGSRYISEHELPRFVGSGAKPVLPVMLQPVDFERPDLRGLAERQIFRLEGERFQHPKAFADCTGAQRDRFVAALFRQIEARLDGLTARP